MSTAVPIVGVLLAIAYLCLFHYNGVVEAPIAAKKPHVTKVHDIELVDDYNWLKEKENPDVLKYLNAENAYTTAHTSSTDAFREQLYNEMVSRLKQTDLSVPYKYGPYYYYSRTEEGKQYKYYCRKLAANEDELKTAKEELLLDVNDLAEGHSFCSLGEYDVSPDHKTLAYSVDFEGNEQYMIQFKNLVTGETSSESITNTDSLEWGNDNKTIFYTIRDDADRPYKVLRHTMGQKEEDSVIFHEEDDGFHVGLEKTSDEKYIIISAESAVTTEARYFDASDVAAEPKLFYPRTQDVEYSVYHKEGTFYVCTNQDALNFKLMSVEVDKVDPKSQESWKEVIPHRKNVKLSRNIDVFKRHLVLWERIDGLMRANIWQPSNSHHVEFDEPCYFVYSSINAEYDTDYVRFMYSSMTTPKSVYEYDMSNRVKYLKKQEEVLGGYDASLYKSERIFATGHDGVKIPVSLVYKKSLFKKDGSNPGFLYGYGSYGYTIDPTFNANRFCLLDRGFVFAIAHIRGSSIMGRQWYEDGKYLKKQNTFKDFISVAEHLLAQKYTTSDKLAIQGGSAGGLLIGAVVNMAPQLFRAAILDVPFVDVVNTMLDDQLPLTVVEYEEWGNPNDKTYFEYMLSYSPYDNIKPVNYPSALVLAGLNDPRVQYWEAAKYVAKLRATKADKNLLLLKTNMDQGHSGASGRYDYLKEIAFEYSFILEQLNVPHEIKK